VGFNRNKVCDLNSKSGKTAAGGGSGIQQSTAVSRLQALLKKLINKQTR